MGNANAIEEAIDKEVAEIVNDLLPRLRRVSRALRSHRMSESADVIDEAVEEIVSLRDAAMRPPPSQEETTRMTETRMTETRMTELPPPEDEIDDGEQEETVPETPSTQPKPFALRLLTDDPNAEPKYFQAFQFAPWDVHLNRVGSPGCPGVWNEEMARAMAACFSKLGARVEPVDVSALSLHRG